MPLALLDAWPGNYSQGASAIKVISEKLDKCKEAWDDEFDSLVRNYKNDTPRKYSAQCESGGLTFFGETSKKDIAKWTPARPELAIQTMPSEVQVQVPVVPDS